jgi:hypothetical protein
LKISSSEKGCDKEERAARRGYTASRSISSCVAADLPRISL